MTENYEHAVSNAKAWFEEIRDAYRLQDATADGKESEQALDRMREAPLSVEVRGGWHTAGAEIVGNDAAEYVVLLSTGGPALRVWGEIGRYSEPENAQLQMQDWGVPWLEVWPCSVEEMDEARDALLWFAGLFYYGE